MTSSHYENLRDSGRKKGKILTAEKRKQRIKIAYVKHKFVDYFAFEIKSFSTKLIEIKTSSECNVFGSLYAFLLCILID